MQIELGIDLTLLTVNFDELLNSSELQFSHLSNGNNNTHPMTSLHDERLHHHYY